MADLVDRGNVGYDPCMPRKKLPPLKQPDRDRESISKWPFTLRDSVGNKETVNSIDVTLRTLGFMEGDLVQYGGQGVNAGGTVWRIVKDMPPRFDAVRREIVMKGWQRDRNGKRLKYTTTKWCDPNTRKVLSNLNLHGHVIIRPVYSFMPFVPGRNLSAWTTPKYKRVPYSLVQERLRRIDIVELGAKWSELKDLIDLVVKERSE